MICTVEGLTSTKATRLKQISQDVIPETHISHDKCERKCNDLVEAFRSDLIRSHPHLKDRLFLRPKNEYGTEKFVCTYIQPTLLPYAEMYDLKSCASFVANYLNYEPLEDGSGSGDEGGGDGFVDFHVVSPAQTLEWAVGDCLDCSILLASLLIGAGYNAYVVLGTAPSWIRLKDRSHMRCSSDSRRGVADDDDDIARVFNPQSAEMDIKDEDYAQKSYCGDGMHCWLLVKAGKRNLECVDGFFVEASTGMIYPIFPSSPYSRGRVFSVWNDANCWVNIGDGVITEKGLDLADSDEWMPVLPSGHFAPYSWVNALSLPKEKYALRYPPNGKRIINVHKAKMEVFGEDIDSQGITSRVTHYEDTARTIAMECNELFHPSRRSDHMIRRVRRPMENATREYFSKRSEMIERATVAGRSCTCEFREKTRADGMVRRTEEAASSITEHFVNRSDGLATRRVQISPLPKDAKVRMSELSPLLLKNQKVVVERIDEQFEAPPDTSGPQKVVARRSYLPKERSVKVKYHCEHEVLQSEDAYSKDDAVRGKELAKLETASVSAVKRTQAEMMQLAESKFRQEARIGGNSEGGARRPSTPSDPNKGEKAAGAAVIDYLSPYLRADGGPLKKEEAARARSECLGDMKERLMERASVIRSKLDRERRQLSDSRHEEEVGDAEASIKFRIELLEKRLSEHEERAITKYRDLERRLDEDIRLASLHLH